MTEAHHPHSETSGDTDDEEDKKDQKKRATTAHLGALSAHEHVSGERPHKLGGELLRPLSVELPKQPEPEALEREHAVQPDELKRLHDEVSETSSEDEDDPELEKPGKQESEHPADEAEAPQLPAADIEPVVETSDRITSEFQKIVKDPGVAELAAMDVPERHTASDAEPSVAEPRQALLSPDVHTAEDSDAVFNEIVESSLGQEAPGAAHFSEQKPGETPVEMHVGTIEPPQPSTAEDIGWDDDESNPWGQPAGGLANPAVLKNIDAIDSRQKLDDSYHTSRENGLASAVGLIGLGLILEHFAAKRRDKKLKRQVDTQARHLRKTNQALQLEKRAHQTSQHKLGRLNEAQVATNEHVRSILPAVQGAEIAAAAAHGTTEQTKVQEKVLAQRLMESRELGRAIKQNPELKEVNDVHELKRSLEVAHASAAQQEREIDGLKRDGNYEHLQGKYADSRGSSKSGGGSGVDTHGMPVLPTPQQQLPAGVQADLILDEHALTAKRGVSSATNVVPVAAATILVLLSAAIVILFALR